MLHVNSGFPGIRNSSTGIRNLRETLQIFRIPVNSLRQFRIPPGLLAAFRGLGTRSVPRAREDFLEANVTGSRLLRQFCTYVGLMLKTAGHENQHVSSDL